ncbi:regulatory signaling modulator protein AmpE [Pseudomonas sp. RIT-PI-AD]|uniref:regulatory signaling modulator protein AmpE n=1 Tax=Pseudomonas sp. RIT-PI-AD TaxID=3035294 RepID=UPI0021D91740|nr:regulatory signaling modulator protein AmpE [Pseudomonas sp. RIT-PI-AD]
MSFLVLLLLVWVEKFSAWRRRVQNDGPWLRQLAGLQARPRLAARPGLILAVSVLLPVLLLAALLLVLQPLAYGWLALPVHLLVMIYSLGRGDVLAELGAFRDAWRRGDGEAAYRVAERDLGLQAEDQADLLGGAQAYLLWHGYQRFFAVIFWYALLGPTVALGYRLLALTVEHATEPALQARAQQWRHALDWLPVRVLAASFALVGDFVAVSRVLLHDVLAWDVPAARFVTLSGRAAADVAQPVLGESGVAGLDALWQLLVRAALLWYVAFAVWVLLL